MWNRCHWRLLFNIAQNNSATYAFIKTFPKSEEALTILNAMNVDEAVYKFATHCGSWDWGLIAIVLVSGTVCDGVGDVRRLFRFLHFDLDHRRNHEGEHKGVARGEAQG